MKKNNVITFRVCEKTQNMMDEELDWCKREKTPPYAKWQAKDGDTVITLYNSGKVVFQGSDADLASSFWIDTERINSGKVDIKSSKSTKKDKLDKSIKVDPKVYNSSSIGSDEVGTGDYFGPIIVTATLVDKSTRKLLEDLKIMDSKKMTDDKIRRCAPIIMKKIPYVTFTLSNTKYNELTNKGFNMNKIKAILHNKVLYELSNKGYSYQKIIVDQFTTPRSYFSYLKQEGITDKVTKITFLTKGESAHLSVAAASVISRYLFLEEMDKLSNKYNVTILKGASDKVNEVAKQIVKNYGKDELNKIAKLNFKNTEKVLGNS